MYKNGKKLEDATKGDFLVYLQGIGYAQKTMGIIAEVMLIPSGSVLEIVSIYRKKDGLCTIKVNKVCVLGSPSLILIDNYKTFNYNEFMILDKLHKHTLDTLYDIRLR